MRERPILFSGPMVRAILDGRKTQTRRIVRNETEACSACFNDQVQAVPHNDGDGGLGVFGSDPYLRVAYCEHTDRGGGRIRCPYGFVGDRLWVRETWGYAASRYCKCPQPSEPQPCDDWIEGDGCRSYTAGYLYAATDDRGRRWRPSIHMPRAASRITLNVTGVRVERLQDISADDVVNEGIDPSEVHGIGSDHALIEAFRTLWDGINGERAAWATNPWVWVVSFKRIDAQAVAA